MHRIHFKTIANSLPSIHNLIILTDYIHYHNGKSLNRRKSNVVLVQKQFHFRNH